MRTKAPHRVLFLMLKGKFFLMSKCEIDDLGRAVEPITYYNNPWDDPMWDDPYYSGMLFVIAVTVIILFIVVSLLVDNLPDKMSEKVSRSTPYIFIGIPILAGLLYALVFN